MFEIRRLLPPDAEQYRRIRLSTLATNPDYFGSTYEEESTLPLSDFAARLANAATFGACTDQGVVGTMLLRRETRPREAHKGHVNGVFVEPAWRGRGIAAALLTALIADARQDLEQLILTVMAGNDAAIALYQRFGFVTYGVEPRARKLAFGYADNVLMALLLT